MFSLYPGGDKPVDNSICGSVDLVVTCNDPVLVDTVRTGGTGDRGCAGVDQRDGRSIRPSQESLVSSSVTAVLSDNETALVNVIHVGLPPG